MDSQPPFDRLRQELWRRGLPPRYVERVVRELQDHQEDLHDEQAGAAVPTADRLGEPNRLAEAIAAEYRASTFGGRHPVWTFLAVPLPLVLLVWVASFVAFGLIGNLLGHVLEDELNRSPVDWPPGLLWGLLTFHYALLVLPPAGTAVLCCRWAYRSGRGRWSWAACGLIALLAGSVLWSLHLSNVPGESSLTLGTLLWMPSLVRMPDFSPTKQLVQAAAPLGVGIYFLLRRRQRLRRLACGAEWRPQAIDG